MAREDEIRPADEALVVNFDEADPWLSRLYIGDAHSGFEYPLTPSTLPPLLDQLTSVAAAQRIPSQQSSTSPNTPPAKEKSAIGRTVGATARWTAGAAKTVSGKKAVDKAMENPRGRKIMFGVSAVLALIILVIWIFF
jgi:hypothetical protein